MQDGTCSAAFMGDPGLASAPTGSPPYYALQMNSPAIGQGDATVCAIEPTDQAGQARPASGCDLGAVQYIAPAVRSSSGWSSGSSSVKATDVPPPTGYILVNQGYQLWAQHGLASGVQFKRVDASGVGNSAVIDLGVIDAIDVWGYVEQGVQVCFPQARQYRLPRCCLLAAHGHQTRRCRRHQRRLHLRQDQARRHNRPHQTPTLVLGPGGAPKAPLFRVIGIMVHHVWKPPKPRV